MRRAHEALRGAFSLNPPYNHTGLSSAFESSILPFSLRAVLRGFDTLLQPLSSLQNTRQCDRPAFHLLRPNSGIPYLGRYSGLKRSALGHTPQQRAPWDWRVKLRQCAETLESVGRTSEYISRYSYLFLVAEKRGQEWSTSFYWINIKLKVDPAETRSPNQSNFRKKYEPGSNKNYMVRKGSPNRSGTAHLHSSPLNTSRARAG